MAVHCSTDLVRVASSGALRESPCRRAAAPGKETAQEAGVHADDVGNAQLQLLEPFLSQNAQEGGESSVGLEAIRKRELDAQVQGKAHRRAAR